MKYRKRNEKGVRERERQKDREVNFMIPWGETSSVPCSIVDMHVSFRIYMRKCKCVHIATISC